MQGDQILAVNKEDMRNATQEYAAAVLKVSQACGYQCRSSMWSPRPLNSAEFLELVFIDEYLKEPFLFGNLVLILTFLQTLMGKVSLTVGRLKAGSRASSRKNSTPGSALKKSESSVSNKSKGGKHSKSKSSIKYYIDSLPLVLISWNTG